MNLGDQSNKIEQSNSENDVKCLSLSKLIQLILQCETEDLKESSNKYRQIINKNSLKSHNQPYRFLVFFFYKLAIITVRKCSEITKLIKTNKMGNSIQWVCEICSKPMPKENKCLICQKFACEDCNSYAVYDQQTQKHARGCKSCFKAQSKLDFSRTYDIFGEQNSKQVIFLHGATASRLMFQPQAKELASKGFRCILVDLPGHGAKMDQSMNIENCQRVVNEAIKSCKTDDITLIGGSLGGYILMNLLGRNPKICKRAVVMMCGQDVGVNRGVKASFGLWAIYKSCSLLPQYMIANNFLSMSKSNQHLDQQLVLRMMRGGCFVKPCGQNMELLKSCNYRESLETLQGSVPILFVNGSQDFRDSESIWVQAAGKKSKLLVYEKGDHFFSHDKRFYDRLIEDIVDFIGKQ